MGLRIKLRSEREQGAGGEVPELSVLSDPQVATASPRWFVAADGVQQGPFEAADVRARLAAGHVTQDTLVWHEGMSGWVPLAEVADLVGRPVP